MYSCYNVDTLYHEHPINYSLLVVNHILVAWFASKDEFSKVSRLYLWQQKDIKLQSCSIWAEKLSSCQRIQTIYPHIQFMKDKSYSWKVFFISLEMLRWGVVEAINLCSKWIISREKMNNMIDLALSKIKKGLLLCSIFLE